MFSALNERGKINPKILRMRKQNKQKRTSLIKTKPLLLNILNKSQ